MPLRSSLIRLGLAFALIAVVQPAVGGLVDFSEKLIAYVSGRWGREAPPRLSSWQSLVRDTKPSATRESKGEGPMLTRANRFFNQVPYVSDMRHWGADDYWATPVEMLGSFGGDCEDYAIAKFLTLKELGIAVEKLRITYVRAANVGEAHMVLAYYPTPDAEPLILDNLVGEVKRASQRPDLEPVYSFNDEDLWLPNGTSRKGGSSQVRLWREFQEKLAREQSM